MAMRWWSCDFRDGGCGGGLGETDGGERDLVEKRLLAGWADDKHGGRLQNLPCDQTDEPAALESGGESQRAVRVEFLHGGYTKGPVSTLARRVARFRGVGPAHPQRRRP